MYLAARASQIGQRTIRLALFYVLEQSLEVKARRWPADDALAT
jgi:hypothetical protein